MHCRSQQQQAVPSVKDVALGYHDLMRPQRMPHAPRTACRSQQQQAVPSVKGVALGYDDLMRSMVYDPADVPVRHTRREIAEQLDALYNQYDNEDFDLGIKQFMIEQAIQQVGQEGVLHDNSRLYSHAAGTIIPNAVDH